MDVSTFFDQDKLAVIFSLFAICQQLLVLRMRVRGFSDSRRGGGSQLVGWFVLFGREREKDVRAHNQNRASTVTETEARDANVNFYSTIHSNCT